MERLRRRRAAVAAATTLAAAVVAVSASPAFAGEVTGNGKPTAAREHMQTRSAPSRGRTMETRRQGGLPRTSRAGGRSPRKCGMSSRTEGSHPGDACNGRTGFLAGGGGE